MKPWLLETAKEFKGKVKFVAVDVDKNEELQTSYEAVNMPTFVVIKGGEEVARVVGANKEEILSAIKGAM